MESRSALGNRANKSTPPTHHPLNRSYSNTDVAQFEKITDGSISDSAITTTSTGNIMTTERKRRPSIGYKMAALVGLNRKSRSTSQLGVKGSDCNADQTSARRIVSLIS